MSRRLPSPCLDIRMLSMNRILNLRLKIFVNTFSTREYNKSKASGNTLYLQLYQYCTKSKLNLPRFPMPVTALYSFVTLLTGCITCWDQNVQLLYITKPFVLNSKRHAKLTLPPESYTKKKVFDSVMASLRLAVITLVTFSLLLSCVQSKRGGYQKAYFPMFCSQNDMYLVHLLILAQRGWCFGIYSTDYDFFLCFQNFPYSIVWCCKYTLVL